MSQKHRFFRRFSRLFHIFWIAVFCDSVYILKYLQRFLFGSAAAIARGERLSAVPDMLEHVLMSAVLLAMFGLCAELLRRHT